MNPIVAGIGKKALDLFYKKFGRRIIKTAADSKWLTNTIRLLKQKAHKPKTSDVAQRVRQKIKKDKPIIPKEFNKFEPYNKFEPKIVKPINVPEQTKNILNIKSTLKGRPVRVVKPKLKVEKSNVIPLFPKKPLGKADGGSVDKALSGRSRDI